MSSVAVRSIEELRDFVLSSPHVHFMGAGTKSALSSDATVTLNELCGILQYDPSEFTFTALAGTPLQEIHGMLSERNQFLPFDPPFVEAGATLGGTVSAGLSGAGRFRYGGVRDFLLGVRLVTRAGRIVFGGGKVVKNAAGFDIPKLMVGSQGRFGALVELVFKVFPRPEAFATVRFNSGDLHRSIGVLTELASRPLDLTCLDLEPPGRIVVRIGGERDAIPQRIRRITEIVKSSPETLDDEVYWNAINEFAWLPKDFDLIKIPLSPHQISLAESLFESFHRPMPRRYSVGGNLLWLGWPSGDTSTKLEGICARLQRNGLALTGKWSNPVIGLRSENPFLERLDRVFMEFK